MFMLTEQSVIKSLCWFLTDCIFWAIPLAHFSHLNCQWSFYWWTMGENKRVESIWRLTFQLKVSIYTKHSLGWSQYSKVTHFTPRKANTNIVSSVTSKNDRNLCCYFHFPPFPLHYWKFLLGMISVSTFLSLLESIICNFLCSRVSVRLTDWNDDKAWQYNWDDIDYFTYNTDTMVNNVQKGSYYKCNNDHNGTQRWLI